MSCFPKAIIDSGRCVRKILFQHFAVVYIYVFLYIYILIIFPKSKHLFACMDRVILYAKAARLTRRAHQLTNTENTTHVVRLFVCLFVRSFVCLCFFLPGWLAGWVACLLVCLLACSLICFTYLLTHLLTYYLLTYLRACLYLCAHMHAYIRLTYRHAYKHTFHTHTHTDGCLFFTAFPLHIFCLPIYPPNYIMIMVEARGETEMFENTLKCVYGGSGVSGGSGASSGPDSGAGSGAGSCPSACVRCHDTFGRCAGWGPPKRTW